MASTDQLLTMAAKSVVVHPLVLLSIQDHAARVAKGNRKRVVGILLGQDLGPQGINVANSFAVPFEEDDKDPRTWFLDHNYIEAMNDMFKKVNAREKLIGWYHTGPRLRASDLQINEVIKRYTPKPVMVIVDVRPDAERGGGGIPTDAYFAVEEIKDDGTSTQKTFLHVPSSIEAEEAEEIGVEHLLRDVKNLSVGTLSSRVADQLSSLRGLQSRLAEVRDYLEQVVSGALPVNHQIVYNLQDIFNLLPNLDGASMSTTSEATSSKRPFTVATNDQLLVVYISSLIRAVLNKQAAAESAAEDTEEQHDKDGGKQQKNKDAEQRGGKLGKERGISDKGEGGDESAPDKNGL
ncbi:proteasome regulatory particle subunit [Microbotryomycetes sp. JL201]|nr:proteasome regulatory particle subunit [Microbotryomycetes sp. JL201]